MSTHRFTVEATYTKTMKFSVEGKSRAEARKTLERELAKDPAWPEFISGEAGGVTIDDWTEPKFTRNEIKG